MKVKKTYVRTVFFLADNFDFAEGIYSLHATFVRVVLFPYRFCLFFRCHKAISDETRSKDERLPGTVPGIHYHQILHILVPLQTEFEIENQRPAQMKVPQLADRLLVRSEDEFIHNISSGVFSCFVTILYH